MNDDDDLAISSEGDFITNESERQEIYYIMSSTFNYFKHQPFYAINLLNNINGPFDYNIFKKNVRELLRKDGFSDIKIDLSDPTNALVGGKRI